MCREAQFQGILQQSASSPLLADFDGPEVLVSCKPTHVLISSWLLNHSLVWNKTTESQIILSFVSLQVKLS